MIVVWIVVGIVALNVMFIALFAGSAKTARRQGIE